MKTLSPIEINYDVVVVGARVAGAATAMLLARRGLRVLVVDRSRYGSDTLSTHALMRGGVVQLSRWGLLDAIRSAETPAIRRVSFHYADDVVTVPIKQTGGVDGLYAPRRTVIDAVLADAASAAGARMLFGPRLIDLIRGRGDQVRGVVLEDREGRILLVRAGLVIGADGQRSTVASLVESEAYREGRHASGVVYGYWKDLEVEPGQYHWHYQTGVSAGVIPTNGATCVFISVPRDRFLQETRRDIASGYHQALREVSPGLAAAVERARSVGTLRGFAGQTGFFRRSWGPGWALVGDAGYFKDPITAHGMTDALRDAELLASAVATGTDLALSDYQQTRDSLSTDVFDVTDEIAGFGWSLGRVRELHQDLSRGMAPEVSHLLELDVEMAAAG